MRDLPQNTSLWSLVFMEKPDILMLVPVWRESQDCMALTVLPDSVIPEVIRLTTLLSSEA